MEDRNLKRPISDALETEKSEEDEFIEVKDDGEWSREAMKKEHERLKKYFEQLSKKSSKSPVRSSMGWVERLRFGLTMLAGVLMGSATAIAALPNIVRFFGGNLLVGSMAVGSIGLLVIVFLLALFSSARKESFVDLDEKILRRQVEGEELEKAEGMDTLRAILRSKHEPPRYYDSVSIEEVSPKYLSEVEQKLSSQSLEITGFEHHMNSLVRSLDLHINLAENKASLLLDKGTTYLWRGIFFYICSIVVWQVATSLYEVGKFAVWGMISCSLTFLVVEFLAAWFLRQYKSFTDSSFNLVRVKSVFNRYLLSYLAIKEFSNSGEHLVDMRAQMLKVLEEDVKWLEPAPQKSGDLNHMIAMFESVSGLVEKLKVSAKDDKSTAST